MRTTIKRLIYYLLRLEAKAIILRYKPKIVAITGSVGKTSTKDAVFAVLSEFAYVRKSEKSYNTQIGLPLTILGVPNGWNNLSVWFQNLCKGLWLIIWKTKYPEWLVLEVGVGKPGDMQTTASWLPTDVVIITAIGDTPVHIEFFNSRDHLVEEKMKLIDTLKKGGVLILNADDETVRGMKSRTKNQVFTYGTTEGSTLVASDLSVSSNKSGGPSGLIFRVEVGGHSLPVAIDDMFGRNHVYASLAALTFAYSQNFNLVESIEALRNHEAPPGRMRLLPGINGSFLIDDTYNSSPFATQAALNTLGEVKAPGRKIAILGDMLELGRHTKEEHEKVGHLAKENADILMVVGPRSQDTKTSAIESGMKKKNIFEFNDSRSAGEFAKDFVQSGDLVLIKGSQGMRMERTVALLLSPEEKKEKLLVRQEREWTQKE